MLAIKPIDSKWFNLLRKNSESINEMKKILTILIISTLCFGVKAQKNKKEIKIGNSRVELIGDSLQILFRADIGKRAVKSGRTLIIAPLLSGNGYSWSLPAIAVKKRRAKVATMRRNWSEMAPDIEFDNATIVTRPGTIINYNTAVAWQEWMEGADIVAEGIDLGCCDFDDLSTVVLAENIAVLPYEPEIVLEPIVEEVIPEPSTGDKLAEKVSYIASVEEFETIEPGKLFDEDRENSLMLYFKQGKYDLDRFYGDNHNALLDLMTSIREIEQSSDSKVKGIFVAGFASPEGGFEFNDRLAWNRAVTVKEYILERSRLRTENVKIYNGSIDWKGLKMLVEQSDMYMKHQIIAIIDHTPIWDSQRQVGRLGELMRLDQGRAYRYMYKHFFPLLRNAAYIKIYYENIEKD